jgi:hypothetical protein
MKLLFKWSHKKILVINCFCNSIYCTLNVLCAPLSCGTSRASLTRKAELMNSVYESNEESILFYADLRDLMGSDNSVSIPTLPCPERVRNRGSIIGGEKSFLYPTALRPALGSTQRPNQWVPGVLSPVLKRPERKADRSPPSSADVKNGGAIPPLFHVSS